MQRLVLTFLLVALVASASAATWQIEKDGSGDFTIIQEAVNASASGDTILIGPGRYDDTVTFTNPYVTWTVCVVVPGTDLTFIGMGRNATFIGPAVPGEMTNDGWRGFVNWPNGVGRLVLENIAVDNMFAGMQVYPSSLEMRDCKVSDCYVGIFIADGTSSLIERCEFAENATGIDMRTPCSSTTIRDCNFMRSDINDFMYGVYAVGVADIMVEDCTFNITQIYLQSSTGTIRRCEQWNSLGGNIYLISGNYIIDDNVIDGEQQWACIQMENNQEVVGSGNILRGASGRAVGILNTRASFTGNHIFSNAEFVHAYGFIHQPLVELDFRNNYWGTSNPSELAARIHDGYDDPSEYVHVLYEPYSNVPMSNEERSWGEIKALYKQ